MLPTMRIGDLDVTRLIAGSNPFTGKSHMTPATDADMKAYFTEEQAFAMLRRCEEAGINAVQSRGSMPVMGLLGKYRASGGRTKGPRKRTQGQNVAFETALRKLIQTSVQG